MSGINVTDNTGLVFTGVEGTLAAGAFDYSDVITKTAVAGQHTNIATVTGTVTDGGGNTSNPTDNDPANYFGISTAGQITPTGTNCDQYITGKAENFEDYYAYQKGVIQYNDSNAKKGVINSTNPGVFFYYTGGGGDFKADDNGDGKLDAFGVNIDQKNSLNRDDLLFGTVKNDVKLYGVVDNGDGLLNGNVFKGRLDTCTQIQFPESALTINKGDVTLNFAGGTAANDIDWYVLGVKYDTNTIKGVNTANNTLAFNTNFETNSNGILVETDLGGVNTAYKFA